MSEHFDVAIVGARCAGASLAVFLARSGMQVGLFDRDPVSKEYVLSTHAIHPPGMDVLDELGIGDRVRKVSPASRVYRFEIDGTFVDGHFRDGRSDYCPRRSRLDRWLQDAAVEAGAQLFDQTCIVKLIWRGDRVVGIRARHHDSEREIRAGLVVGADGRRSTVAKLVQAQEYLGYDAPRAAFWAYWPAPACWSDSLRYPFDQYLCNRGPHSRIIFQTDDNELILGTAPPVERAQAWKENLSYAYISDLKSDPTIGPFVEENNPTSEIRGFIKERYFFRQPVGPGWVLVGDAGHHKDFHVGDGITEALRQARSVAKAIVAGGAPPLARWWRERDIEALPLFRLGEELGAATPSRGLARHVFKRLALTGDGAARFLDVFDRRLLAYDAIPFPIVLRSTFDALLAGEFGAFQDFLAQGRRQAAQRKELAERKKLGMDGSPTKLG